MERQGDEPEFGSDSFLDVVTNVVGILIILVVVVGLRIKQAPAREAVLAVDLETPRAVAEELDREVAQVDQEVGQLEQELRQRELERQQVALLVATGERELEAVRARLSEHSRTTHDLQATLQASQLELASLENQVTQLQGQRPEAVRVVTYPTPLAHAVEGQESHFMLHEGLVMHLPIANLLELCKSEAQSRLWKLKNSPAFTGTVGPIDGVRLQYTLERVDVAMEGGGQVAAFAQLAQWELLPTNQPLGESASEALAENSDFHRHLAKLVPRKTTVTLWTYPDSFDLYRQLKQDLFQRGFATAGRPLPDDIPIGGSPDGSRSAAQ